MRLDLTHIFPDEPKQYDHQIGVLMALWMAVSEVHPKGSVEITKWKHQQLLSIQNQLSEIQLRQRNFEIANINYRKKD